MNESADVGPFAEYYTRLENLRLAPLWERLRYLLPPEPVPRAAPYLWDYDALRSTLLESADLIGAADAERRVLILENPELEGESAATDALFAGLQLIMPGEIAPSHRHTPAALRFIIESDNAYTSVDGEPIPMSPGDFILTPSWSWHDHSHEGAEPVVWLDVLDLPLVRAIGPRFAEHHELERAPQTAPAGTTVHKFGMNMAPLGPKGRHALLSYPYSQARDALEHLKSNSERDARHGLKLEYIDPTSGGSAMPTISAFLQLLPAGFNGERYRSTEGSIFCVVAGTGRVTIETENPIELEFKPRDIFAIPCWMPYRFAASEETVLFSASDRAAQTRLGLWREEQN